MAGGGGGSGGGGEGGVVSALEEVLKSAHERAGECGRRDGIGG